MAIRTNIKILLLLALWTGFFSCKKKSTGDMPDMRVTLASNDTAPMGGKVFRNIAGEVFGDFVFESKRYSVKTG